MSEPAVTLTAHDVHVVYRTYLDGRPMLRRRLRGGPDAQARYRDVHAVRGVDLTLTEGECLGLVGSNGSGKSSLLTGLAGLIELEAGEVMATSRPALLGVGAALNRRLSGRRNVEIGCLALGLSRDDIDARMESIIDFSGLAESIDMPMRTYSSGMRARLAFTIATELSPEILLIDEALAVGDRSFKRRAAERLEELRAQAGSIVVVSHNLGEIADMSTRVAWMDEGRLRLVGDPDEVLDAYKEANDYVPGAPTRKARKKQARRARGRARRAPLAEAAQAEND